MIIFAVHRAESQVQVCAVPFLTQLEIKSEGKGRRGEEGRGREAGREGAECEDLLPTAAGLVTYLSHGEEVAQEDSSDNKSRGAN